MQALITRGKSDNKENIIEEAFAWADTFIEVDNDS
jgi:hypothetical protein